LIRGDKRRDVRRVRRRARSFRRCSEPRRSSWRSSLYWHERKGRQEDLHRLDAQQANLILLQVRPETFPDGKIGMYTVAGEILNESDAQICAITALVTDTYTGRTSKAQEVVLAKASRSRRFQRRDRVTQRLARGEFREVWAVDDVRIAFRLDRDREAWLLHLDIIDESKIVRRANVNDHELS
jgi:hypothetical protein